MIQNDNAHGGASRGRLSATNQETSHPVARSVNDASVRGAGTPSFEAVREYRGVRLDLIPLRPQEKIPADRGWRQRAYDHSATVERVRREGMNLGVRLPGDVVVLDVDPRNFPKGRDSLAELVASVGLDLAAAPHVVTGNLDYPGHHYYFRKPIDAVLLDSIEGFPGVEFKSLGRQVVAAGSVHPTGGLYRWAPDSPPLHAMPDLPTKLVKMAQRPAGKRPSEAGEITPEQLARCLVSLDPTDFQDHERWLELMMACHHATNGEGRLEFIDWSTSDPSYADHDWIIGRRWDSLHASRECAVTIATLRHYLSEAGTDIVPPDAADEFEVWDEVETSKARSRWIFMSMEEVEALPPPKWLVPGVLTEGSLAAIYGAPESGKSFLAVDMAMAVASGLYWHGRTVEHGGVLYIAAEGAPGLGKRFRAWKLDRCAQGRSFAFHLMHDDLNLATERNGSVRDFVEAVTQGLGSLRLIVIDTLNQTAAGADENSAKDMGRYIASMKMLRDATGATVVVVHHSGKDLSKGMRGSTALLGAMDTTIEVERHTNGRSIKVAVKKQKDAERESPMHFNMEKVGESLVLRPTVMEVAPGEFGSAVDPVLELARQSAEERGGSIPLKELAEIICDRDGGSDATARRKIKASISDGRSNAKMCLNGHLVWSEPVDSRNPKLGILVKTEG